MNEDSARQELVKKLDKCKVYVPGNGSRYSIDKLCDFILEDRRRIVAPLVNHNIMLERKLQGKPEQCSSDKLRRIVEHNGNDAIYAINETLKLAQIE